MPELVWDKVGDRYYETGLDRGVLYLPDGSGVPWNGLTSVIENFDQEVSTVYYDGMKINDLVTLGNFSASMRALTYPDEFSELEGMRSSDRGLLFGNQMPQLFGLCYRTKIGNDLDGIDKGYKIHIVYNVLAIPKEKVYSSISEEPIITEFEWDITAVPEEVPGIRPTAHLVIDSRNFDPWLLEDLEDRLYGSSFTMSALVPMNDLVKHISEWYRFKIIDNGDGTWTAISTRSEAIQFDSIDEDVATLIGVNAIYLNEYTYQISDTDSIRDVLRLRIIDNGDGTWQATGNFEDVSVDEEHRFEIKNTEAVFINSNTYRVSSIADNT